ncbi:MAG: hypothetical protein WCG75_07435 [Armatimonadota bacterium]
MATADLWFLENIIDFAGIFPPGSLSPLDAIRSYRAYQTGGEKWILGSLAWTCSTLSDLDPLLTPNDEFEMALIGRPSTTWESWQDARIQDVEDVNRLLDHWPSIGAATYESRIEDLSKITDAMNSLRMLGKETDIYLELPWDQPIDDVLAEIACEEWVRVKFRTGGKTKDAYPSPSQLASVLKQCIDLEIEFKLTAGLHEPITHVDSKIGTLAFGFLNVLMATSMAFHDDASIEEMAGVLESTDVNLWSVQNGLNFNGKVLGRDELNDARSFFGSFGSCSISEPLDGLQRLQG